MADTLLGGQRLGLGDSLFSYSNAFMLSFQGDGNLVLSIESQGTAAAAYVGPVWAAYTQNRGAATCIMQEDGNLVIYDVSGTPLWNSGTEGHPGAFLTVQDDGNTVVYDQNLTPLWQTQTSARQAPGVNA